ncbi:hypothetical protein HMPREF9003_1753 [Bifidobacterium dentium JCVIHMP022]|uniref:Uncharacterized protein n=1 Tax=Bifidobacterium dentium JCVIHMP022 TaxID=553191 RepID=A0AB72YZH3_9BIFI|nr:hypothetical protein HMPREF9003_1753 [Bifidobacterium dentium JCVIHMP022]
MSDSGESDIRWVLKVLHVSESPESDTWHGGWGSCFGS